MALKEPAGVPTFLLSPLTSLTNALAPSSISSVLMSAHSVLRQAANWSSHSCEQKQ